MPDARTTVTELATALGTLRYPTLRSAVDGRPHELAIDAATWDQLGALYRSGRFDAEFATAFANGQAFLEAEDALRGRSPRLVEWTGGRRPPGDEIAPVDLRIDHVYLVSCKYLSRNIANPSPGRLFDGLLATSGEWQGTDGTRWWPPSSGGRCTGPAARRRASPISPTTRPAWAPTSASGCAGRCRAGRTRPRRNAPIGTSARG